MEDQGMPTTYDTQGTTVTTTTSSTVGPAAIQLDYLRTIPGILKISELVLSIITFICAIVWPYWGSYGGAWVRTVSMTAFLSTLVIFIMYLLNVVGRLGNRRILGEFIYYGIFSVLFLIAAVVAAARGEWHGSIAASAFFSFCATAVYAVDTFFQYRVWRSSDSEMAAAQTTTTTTTHSSSMEAGKAVY